MRIYYTCLRPRTNKIKKSTGILTFLVSLIYLSIRLSIYLTIVTNLVCTYTFIDIFHLLEIDIITNLRTYLIKKSAGTYFKIILIFETVLLGGVQFKMGLYLFDDGS